MPYICIPLHYGDTVMQSKSTFPIRITPFSVPEPLPFFREKQRKARFRRETWTYFALLYLHTGRGKIYNLQKSIVTGLLYVYINFKAIWTFLQGATCTWTLRGVMWHEVFQTPRGIVPCNVGKEQVLDTKVDFRREKWCGTKCSK